MFILLNVVKHSKWILVMVALLAAIAGFKYLKANYDDGIVISYQKTINHKADEFSKADKDEVKQTETILSDISDADLLVELCGGDCESGQADLPRRVETNSPANSGQVGSTENEQNVHSEPSGEQPQSKSIQSEMYSCSHVEMETCYNSCCNVINE